MEMLRCIILILVAGLSTCELSPPERSYKILMLLPFSAKSHRKVFMPLAESLADRGHKVVMLSSENKTSRHPSIDEMYHGLPYYYSEDVNIFEARESIWRTMHSIFDLQSNMARDLYRVPHVRELYEKRKEFDLIVVQSLFNEMTYPFLHEMPFITVVTFGVDPCQAAAMGNPFNPSYVHSFLYDRHLSSVFHRLVNAVLLAPPLLCWRDLWLFSMLQKEITPQFPNLPPLSEIEKNQSLTLVNTHFSLDMALPLLPSQIEVGCMHCRAGLPLPQDLKTWIEEAGPDGVVYFSLGSIAKGETMPRKYRVMFVEVFKKLKQRIIWKYEGKVEGVSKNVMIGNWLPQQDILAHNSVKVFISHGGGLSTQESSYHGVPMIVLPLIHDQPKNAAVIAATQRGIYLRWEELTSDLILNTLLEVINNPKYKDNMVSVSRALKDQPETPTERAVYWTEYVIRHKGAPQLKSPAAKLTWIEFFLLDVLSIVIVFAVITLMTLYMTVRKILKFILSTVNKKTKYE